MINSKNKNAKLSPGHPNEPKVFKKDLVKCLKNAHAKGEQLTYAAIGKAFNFSKQRAHYLCRKYGVIDLKRELRESLKATN